MNTKQEVREFYDQTGWSQAGEGLYQNARYEDLRPVVRDYIHRCHLRVNRYLDPTGDLFLDAGSGPVQYPEYLTYSAGYRYRICADISITALREARQRLGEKGLYVVMDIANLPFKPDAFDGLISLHTIHHLPAADHRKAYAELYRVLKPGRRAVVVNGCVRSTGWLSSRAGSLPGYAANRLPSPPPQWKRNLPRRSGRLSINPTQTGCAANYKALFRLKFLSGAASVPNSRGHIFIRGCWEN
jgi:SAM-dependent methyltransferase